MGGDFAPERPVLAALEALKLYPSITELYLVGPEDVILAELKKHGREPDDRLRIHHCTQVIEMGEKPVTAVRRKRDSSINRGMELVKNDLSDAMVSAGHTGAMVAGASILLRTLPGVQRPGIATIMPTQFNHFVLIDAGANADAKAEHLAQYGVMGSIYSNHVLKYEKPRVGLLSIGSEEAKGNDLTKDAFKLLGIAPIDFQGNVEGHDLFEDPVEVVVCDGFSGNVVLKTSESLANAIFGWLKHELKKSPIRLFGAWLARNAFKAIKKRTNYEEYGGSLLLGVKGICVIAHGSSTVKAITNAIRVAVEAQETELNPHIIDEVAKLNEAMAAQEPAPEQATTSAGTSQS